MKVVVFAYLILIFFFGIVLFQDSALKESVSRGGKLYSGFCANCHLDNGQGISFTYPPLANSDFLRTKRKASIHAVKYGLQGKITVNNIPYNGNMISMGLEDDEIADIMNFIMNSWGNTQKEMVTIQEVKSVLK